MQQQTESRRRRPERITATPPRANYGTATAIRPYFYAVLARQIAVEFVIEWPQSRAQRRLVLRSHFAPKLCLLLAEEVELLVQLNGFLLDSCQSILEVERTLTAPDVIKARVAHQRIPRPDVKVNVGQGLDAVGGLDLCHEFQEEAQFADFYRLFHDVHADAVAVGPNQPIVAAADVEQASAHVL